MGHTLYVYVRILSAIYTGLDGWIKRTITKPRYRWHVLAHDDIAT